MDDRTFRQLLSAAIKNGASDIHLRAGSSPALRINGRLVPVKSAALSSDDMDRCAGYVLGVLSDPPPPSQVRDRDLSYPVPDVGRFRASVFRARGELAVVLRVIPASVPTFEDLALPSVLADIALEPRGLVLVTGITGAGKSSTLAAMLGHVNRESRQHVLTIEDPIEFVHENENARITQREIGVDCDDFGSALRSALRQDPDTILVGEMRDRETAEVALQAAETGHLVLSTLHTTDSARTIARLIEMFPKDVHDAMRARLAENLRAIVSQRLLPRVDGAGRVPAVEVLRATDSVRKMVRDDRLEEIPEYLAANTDVYGTQSFDQNLKQLYEAGAISVDTVRAAATRPNDVLRALQLEQTYVAE